MRRAHARATALPTALVEATARANSACEKVWREAKAQSDFALVRPRAGGGGAAAARDGAGAVGRRSASRPMTR